jgi:hypothetical protein|tara:strand:+ start:260 stop:481 length:222 start_codon:yes stop_codon:yes gene_type:complete
MTTIKPPKFVPKPKNRWPMRIVFILILIAIAFSLSSCGTFKMTEKEKTVNYELEKLYLDYSYKRDSIIIEYNK